MKHLENKFKSLAVKCFYWEHNVVITVAFNQTLMFWRAKIRRPNVLVIVQLTSDIVKQLQCGLMPNSRNNAGQTLVFLSWLDPKREGLLNCIYRLFPDMNSIYRNEKVLFDAFLKNFPERVTEQNK